mgnify:CR=1 FL=1
MVMRLKTKYPSTSVDLKERVGMEKERGNEESIDEDEAKVDIEDGGECNVGARLDFGG